MRAKYLPRDIEEDTTSGEGSKRETTMEESERRVLVYMGVCESVKVRERIMESEWKIQETGRRTLPRTVDQRRGDGTSRETKASTTRDERNDRRATKREIVLPKAGIMATVRWTLPSTATAVPAEH
jgi:hypothetical protein